MLLTGHRDTGRFCDLLTTQRFLIVAARSSMNDILNISITNNILILKLLLTQPRDLTKKIINPISLNLKDIWIPNT